MRQRVGARTDRLRLERLEREAVAHLIRHDAEQIVLDRQRQDGHEQPVFDGQRECAGVQIASPAEAQTGHLHGGLIPLEYRAFSEAKIHAAVEQVQLAGADLHGYLDVFRQRKQRLTVHQHGVCAFEREVGAVGQLQPPQEHAHGRRFV